MMPRGIDEHGLMNRESAAPRGVGDGAKTARQRAAFHRRHSGRATPISRDAPVLPRARARRSEAESRIYGSLEQLMAFAAWSNARFDRLKLGCEDIQPVGHQTRALK